MQNDSPAATKARGQWWLDTAQSVVLFLMITTIGTAPRALPALLIAAALLTISVALRTGTSPRDAASAVVEPQPMRAALLLLGFAGLSSIWSADPRLALQSVVQVGVLVLATGALVVLLPPQIERLPPERRAFLVRGVPLGVATALGFILFEFASDNALGRLVVTRFPALMGDNEKEFVRQGDKLLGFLPFYLDRNVAATTLLLPAAFAWIAIGLRGSAVTWSMPILALAAGTVVAISWSGAAKLAALCGIAAALFVYRWPTMTGRVLSPALAVGILLALPIAALPMRLGLAEAGWLPPSTRERVVIWSNTAGAVLQAPWIGIGVQSTRFQPRGDAPAIEGIEGRRRVLGWHAHNAVLQTWLELGLAGALLLLGASLSMLRTITRLPAAYQPSAFALMTMAGAVAVTGWGMWQPWLVAAIGVATAALRMAWSAAPPDDKNHLG